MGIQILHSTEGMIAWDLHPSTWQKKGPFLAGFWLQVVTCSLIDFLTPNHFAQKGQMKTSSGAGCSGP